MMKEAHIYGVHVPKGANSLAANYFRPNSLIYQSNANLLISFPSTNKFRARPVNIVVDWSNYHLAYELYLCGMFARAFRRYCM